MTGYRSPDFMLRKVWIHSFRIAYNASMNVQYMNVGK